MRWSKEHAAVAELAAVVAEDLEIEGMQLVAQTIGALALCIGQGRMILRDDVIPGWAKEQTETRVDEMISETLDTLRAMQTPREDDHGWN